MSTSIFEQITVDLATGTVRYPRPAGFTLDMERVYASAGRFLPFCNGDLAAAVCHAVHQQIIAHQGLLSIGGARPSEGGSP